MASGREVWNGNALGADDEVAIEHALRRQIEEHFDSDGPGENPFTPLKRKIAEINMKILITRSWVFRFIRPLFPLTRKQLEWSWGHADDR